MRLYQVAIGVTFRLPRDEWYLTARSFAEAVTKAERQRKAKGDYYSKDWRLLSVKEVDELRE